MTTTRCTSCRDFDTDRPATCTARLQPSSQATASTARFDLCDTCAGNALIYTDVRPYAEAKAEVDTHDRFAPWFHRLIDLDLTCGDWATYEATAYQGYTRYCATIGAIPISHDAYIAGFRKDPAGTLYFENDARHDLASRVNSYTRIITNIFA